jgi:hypothetical protein
MVFEFIRHRKWFDHYGAIHDETDLREMPCRGWKHPIHNDYNYCVLLFSVLFLTVVVKTKRGAD